MSTENALVQFFVRLQTHTENDDDGIFGKILRFSSVTNAVM